VTGIEAFSVLGAVSHAAPGLGLGTGVVPMQVRTPPLLAMAAACVQALAPGRDVWIGVGVSSPVVAGDWHGAGYLARPLARMREFIALLRECLSAPQARYDLFSYAVVDAYARSFTRAGFGDAVQAIRAAHRSGDRAGALAAVTDEMVDAINVTGDQALVAATISAYWRAGVEIPVVFPLTWGAAGQDALEATLGAAISPVAHLTKATSAPGTPPQR
jgi:alkanesulfonate monooxygenase SsuD/methylene tetrahydromethanopterin reductase-like flavin-dependent oxidoreductase (luciferase family)